MQKQAGKAIETYPSQPTEKYPIEKQCPSEETAPPHNLFKSILESESLPQVEKRKKRIAQEAFVIMAAGGETTGRVLTTATYFLLANKHTILARLREELATVMVNPSSRPDLRVIEKLPWLVSLNSELIPQPSLN